LQPSLLTCPEADLTYYF